MSRAETGRVSAAPGDTTFLAYVKRE